MSPLTLNRRFTEVLGADFLLGQLRAELVVIQPFGCDSFTLLAHGGTYATPPRSGRIGAMAFRAAAADTIKISLKCKGIVSTP